MRELEQNKRIGNKQFAEGAQQVEQHLCGWGEGERVTIMESFRTETCPCLVIDPSLRYKIFGLR